MVRILGLTQPALADSATTIREIKCWMKLGFIYSGYLKLHLKHIGN
jgi:hypothetical protein